MADAGINVEPSTGDGAKFMPLYHDATQPIVGVPVMDIRDATASAKEEVFQFTVGGFLFSGAFWLGLERLITIGYDDTLFLSCIAFCVCGAVLAVVGYRQAMRRVSRLERFLPKDNEPTD